MHVECLPRLPARVAGMSPLSILYMQRATINRNEAIMSVVIAAKMIEISVEFVLRHAHRFVRHGRLLGAAD